MSGKIKPKTRWRKVAFAIPFAAPLFGFSLTYKMLLGSVSPGLSFVLSTAVAMTLFAVLTPLFAAQHKSAQPDGNERKNGRVMPFFIGILFLAALMLSWGATAYLETNALTQPDHATGAYTIAAHLKGVVRFMTPEQYRIDNIAKWTFGGCILGLFCIGLATKYWRQWTDRGDD